MCPTDRPVRSGGIVKREVLMADLQSRNADGSAYGRPLQYIDEELARVGPGTPCGELFRRYWHPIAEADKVTARPQNVRILGEDLVLFRDRKGRPASFIRAACTAVHRSSMAKSKMKEFAAAITAGCLASTVTCLDQPCEPDHGRHRDVARQPWYPVEERYGLRVRLHGPAGEETDSAPIRHPRKP